MEMVMLILACVAVLALIEREKESMHRLQREKARVNPPPRSGAKR